MHGKLLLTSVHCKLQSNAKQWTNRHDRRTILIWIRAIPPSLQTMTRPSFSEIFKLASVCMLVEHSSHPSMLRNRTAEPIGKS